MKIDRVLEAINTALFDKDVTIDCLKFQLEAVKKDNEQLQSENKRLNVENENLRGDLDFYKPASVGK